jgi:DNA replication protein DnaC
MHNDKLVSTQLPKQFWNTKLADVRDSKKLPHDDPGTCFDWLTNPIPLLTIIGPSQSGKTTLAAAITRYWIDVALQKSPDTFDEFNIYWTNAPFIMPVYQRALMYEGTENFENILQRTHFLVLDDLDDIDEKYISTAATLVRGRIDAGNFTLITAVSQDDLKKFGNSIMNRITQGKLVVLHAKH